MSNGAAVAHETHHNPNLAHHFETMEQQTEASILGMWVFLITEILFFGGALMAYMVYRSQYPDAYFAPVSATAYLDLKNAQKVKDKAPSNMAP